MHVKDALPGKGKILKLGIMYSQMPPNIQFKKVVKKVHTEDLQRAIDHMVSVCALKVGTYNF